MYIMKRKPTHPGLMLKMHYMEPLNLSVTEIADILSVSRKTVSKIVNERGNITPDMALRLSQAFKTSPELWIKMQTNYDLWAAAHKSSDWKHVVAVKFAAAHV